MIFCARSLGNVSPWKCESRKHTDPRQYALHGQEPKCARCERVIATLYSPPGMAPITGDSMYVVDIDRIVRWPQDARTRWPPLDRP